MSNFSKKPNPGLSKRVIEEISWQKSEPKWMLEKRLEGLATFARKPLPTWGPNLSGLNFDEISFYQKPAAKTSKTWGGVPKEIRQTYEKIGIPEAERKYLGGAVAQFESEAVYENLKKVWQRKGVIFESLDSALTNHPELVKKYFMTHCVPISDNKFSSLHAAVWSGGSFVFVPKGVSVGIPLQAYFWMDREKTGQFEHTLIIAEEGSNVHYIEGCTAPIYDENSLHSAVVEIFVGKGAKVRYTTVQNWSKNIYNLNTKRSIVNEEGEMEWVSGSLGSKISMLYPSSILKGKRAKANHLNISLAGEGQIKDTGAKVYHLAPETSSNIESKSISLDGGHSIYRGLIKIIKGAKNSVAHMRCDALILDDRSRSDTIPKLEVGESDVTVGHEARTGRIGEEQLFYMQTRGLTEKEAVSIIVNGFLSPISEKLPLEYALELNKLIEVEMKGSVG